MTRAVVLVLAWITICGCEPATESGEQVPAFSAVTRARRFAATSDDVVWTHTGAENDSVLTYPVGLWFDTSLVVVLDGGTKRVVALDARTGVIRFAIGPDGTAGTRFGRLDDIAFLPNGDFAVLDSDSSRIVRFNRRGGVVARIQAPLLRDSYALCAADNETLLVSRKKREFPVGRIRWDRKVALGSEQPWPELRRAHMLYQQARFGHDHSAGACYLAQSLGPGWARIDTVTGSSLRSPFVEQNALPPIRKSSAQRGSTTINMEQLGDFAVAAANSFVSGTHVLIHFVGRTPDRGRVIDAYSSTDGRYEYSYRLPKGAEFVDARDSLTALAYKSRGLPVVELRRIRVKQ